MSIRYLVPEPVREYILDNHLYNSAKFQTTEVKAAAD
jgi:hypothetical protein